MENKYRWSEDDVRVLTTFFFAVFGDRIKEGSSYLRLEELIERDGQCSLNSTTSKKQL